MNNKQSVATSENPSTPHLGFLLPPKKIHLPILILYSKLWLDYQSAITNHHREKESRQTGEKTKS